MPDDPYDPKPDIDPLHASREELLQLLAWLERRYGLAPPLAPPDDAEEPPHA